MHVLFKVLVYLHLIGFALLLGGAIAQYLSGRIRINVAMLVGAATQLVTGLLLASPLHPADQDQPPAAIAIKIVVALAILAMTFFSRNREKVNRGHFIAIVVLALANAAIGEFWL
ncbi:MAG TPA: hypothetical protein VJT31_27635 [Rugosimonospora sp.]|nr:hypothetical protein [Rugosimonospora sp.]